MRMLAEFIMGSRMRAVMAISGLGMLGMLLPPFSLLSSAGIALIVLRKGFKDGLEVLLFAVPATAALGFITLGIGFSVAGYMLIQWLPVFVLASWLGYSRSLASTLVVAMIPSGIIIAIHAIWFANPAEQWMAVLAPLEQAFAEIQLFDDQSRENLMKLLAQWMTGILAAGYFLQNIFALLLARWWQSVLYNPGSFQTEFHQLRLHAYAGLAGLIAIVASTLLSKNTADALDFLTLLLMSAGFINGLALVHGATAIRKTSVSWLIAMYILMFIALAQTVTILAIAGLADAWFDFRSRLVGKQKTNKSDSDDIGE